MNKSTGNQKHLTLSDRITIEKGLKDGKSFAEIGRETYKDPTTISKEVRKHSKIKEYSGYANVPCEANKDVHVKCGLQHICGDQECERKCVSCRKYRCSSICPYYQPQQCTKLSKPPYVCNGCGKKLNCMMDKKIYSSKYADDEYRVTLVSSREGINQTPESIQRINDIITPLIKEKGQSIAHIYATHAQELNCSQRTLYEYIDTGVFEVRNIDLRRAVKYKKRKKSTSCSTKDKSYRIDHNYTDFEEIGATRDDAAGEAFDKIGRVIGLPYPGGAAMDKLAYEGYPKAITLPTPALIGDNLDFSFSGIKTAALNYINSETQKGNEICRADVAASYTKRIVDAIVKKVGLALDKTGTKTLVMAGGVAANSHIRSALTELCKKRGVEFITPSLKLCGDNAAMVAAAGYFEYARGKRADTSLNASAVDNWD